MARTKKGKAAQSKQVRQEAPPPSLSPQKTRNKSFHGAAGQTLPKSAGDIPLLTGDWMGGACLLVWTGIFLAVLVFARDSISSTYLPKMAWSAGWLALAAPVCALRASRTLRWTPLSLMVVLYLGWAALSLLWSPSTVAATERLAYLFLFLCVYGVARASRFWESRTFWVVFCVVVLTVAAVGIMQYVWGRAPWVRDFPGTARPRATMGQRNYASFWFGLTLPFTAWLFYKETGWRRLLAFAAMIGAIAFLLAARTRGAWLGTVIPLVICLVTCRISFIGQRWKGIALAGGCAVGLMVLILLAVDPAEVSDRYGLGGKVDVFRTSPAEALRFVFDPSNRLAMWFGAWGLSNPLLGAGLANFPTIVSPDGTTKALNWEVHNDYYQAYLDLGLPGFLLFIALSLVLWRRAYLVRDRGIGFPVFWAITMLLVIQATTFTTQLVSGMVWFMGVVAILTEVSPGRRVVADWRIPRWAWYPAALALAGWMGFYAWSLGLSVQGDKALFNLLRHWTLVERNETLERDRPVLLLATSRSLDTLRQMRFASHIKHIHCNSIVRNLAPLEEYALEEQFCRVGLRYHPTDAGMLDRLSHCLVQQDKLDEALEILEKVRPWQGANPNASVYRYLTFLYRRKGQEAAAQEAWALGESNRVTQPADPDPPVGARDVSTTATLTWSPVAAATHYNLSMIRSGELFPVVPEVRNLREPRWTPRRPLAPDTVYLWRLEAVGRYGKEYDLWYFKTAKE